MNESIIVFGTIIYIILFIIIFWVLWSKPDVQKDEEEKP